VRLIRLHAINLDVAGGCAIGTLLYIDVTGSNVTDGRNSSGDEKLVAAQALHGSESLCKLCATLESSRWASGTPFKEYQLRRKGVRQGTSIHN